MDNQDIYKIVSNIADALRLLNENLCTIKGKIDFLTEERITDIGNNMKGLNRTIKQEDKC